MSTLVNRLIYALQYLPGVGNKTAQRMAFYLLKNDRQKALELAAVMQEAATCVGYCEHCRTLSEASICELCASSKRNALQLCLVETPADIVAIEQARIYSGLYFVLMGNLSPLDGIGPKELGLDLLEKRLTLAPIEELILATSYTVEGAATAHYITELVKSLNIRVTRIARGVPAGGGLEWVSSDTLTSAFEGRSAIL